MSLIVEDRNILDIGLITSSYPYQIMFYKFKEVTDDLKILRIGDITALKEDGIIHAQGTELTFAGVCIGGGSPADARTGNLNTGGYNEKISYGYKPNQMAQVVLGGEITIPYDTTLDAESDIKKLLGKNVTIFTNKTSNDPDSTAAVENFGKATISAKAGDLIVKESVVIGYNTDAKVLIVRMPRENVLMELTKAG